MGLDHFLKTYTEQNFSRFHMPGHKGNYSPLNQLSVISKYDITEIAGADVLGSPTGILREMEERASSLYGTQYSVISTQGSTLCIQTMLALVAHKGSKVLANRNCHVAFIHACTLLNIKPVWLYPAYFSQDGFAMHLSAQEIEQEIKKNPDVVAVYLTSPDYYGQQADIQVIAEICKRHSIPLLVDNAHGAHLKFLETNLHPIALGATMCCDSLHKTLPALTGTALLHVQDKTITYSQIKSAMALFASTSPSYLLLLSIDLCLSYLEEKACDDFAIFGKNMIDFKNKCIQIGIDLINNTDSTKLCLWNTCLDIPCDQLEREFWLAKIIPEFIGTETSIFMASPFNHEADFNRLYLFLKKHVRNISIKKKKKSYTMAKAMQIYPFNEAMHKEWEEIPASDCLGRISGETRFACPPGIPVVLPGECIQEDIFGFIKKAGNPTINVLK